MYIILLVETNSAVWYVEILVSVWQCCIRHTPITEGFEAVNSLEAHSFIGCLRIKIILILHLGIFYQGVPFPQNEANAMDVVVQFAIHKLGFQLSDIVVYAWSIGGFTGKHTEQYMVCAF